MMMKATLTSLHHVVALLLLLLNRFQCVTTAGRQPTLCPSGERRLETCLVDEDTNFMRKAESVEFPLRVPLCFGPGDDDDDERLRLSVSVDSAPSGAPTAPPPSPTPLVPDCIIWDIPAGEESFPCERTLITTFILWFGFNGAPPSVKAKGARLNKKKNEVDVPLYKIRESRNSPSAQCCSAPGSSSSSLSMLSFAYEADLLLFGCDDDFSSIVRNRPRRVTVASNGTINLSCDCA